jgi:hypothetical protein
VPGKAALERVDDVCGLSQTVAFAWVAEEHRLDA